MTNTLLRVLPAVIMASGSQHRVRVDQFAPRLHSRLKIL